MSLPATAEMPLKMLEVAAYCRLLTTWGVCITSPVCSMDSSLSTSTRICCVFFPLVRMTLPCSGTSSSLDFR
jgi:hypothetical protein